MYVPSPTHILPLVIGLTTHRAERYTRLMKAHGIATPGGTNSESSPTKTPSPKKRKVAEADEESEIPTRGKKNTKEEVTVKDEVKNEEVIA